ncbi:MAG: hypothetical protein ACRBBN_15145 [Methyloligellaceae bacterium]
MTTYTRLRARRDYEQSLPPLNSSEPIDSLMILVKLYDSSGNQVQQTSRYIAIEYQDMQTGEWVTDKKTTLNTMGWTLSRALETTTNWRLRSLSATETYDTHLVAPRQKTLETYTDEELQKRAQAEAIKQASLLPDLASQKTEQVKEHANDLILKVFPLTKQNELAASEAIFARIENGTMRDGQGIKLPARDLTAEENAQLMAIYGVYNWIGYVRGVEAEKLADITTLENNEDLEALQAYDITTGWPEGSPP